MKRKLWQPLAPGDTVEIVAPGSKCTKAEFYNALRFLTSWGLRPQYPKNLFGDDPFCAHSDRTRLQFFKKALLAPHSKAIWCLRGGYGSIRLLPQLAKIRPPVRPKLFIGYSDITSIHHLMNQKWNWPTIHGPLLDRLGSHRTSTSELKNLKTMIFGHDDTMVYSGLKAMNSAARVRKTLQGSFVGGNLSVVQTLVGTSLAPINKNRFVFLEDIDERGYSVDRMLSHLTQAGYFKGAKAVFFGDFVGGKEKNGKALSAKALDRFAKAMKLPVFKGLKVGHGRIQRPLPFNTISRLTAGSSATVEVFTGVDL